MYLRQSKPKEIYVLFTVLLLSTCISVFLKNGLSFIFAIFFIILVYIGLLSSSDDRRFLAVMFLLAFLVRIIAAYAIHLQSWNEGFGGFVSGDDRLYSIKALKLSLIWRHLPYNSVADFGGVDYGVNIFTYMLANFYRFFEPNYFYSKMINCLVGSIAPLFIYGATRKIFGRKEARVACALMCFYPSIVRWSVCNLRDPIVILFVAVFSYLLFSLRLQMSSFFKVLNLLAILFLAYIFKDLQRMCFYAIIASAILFVFYKFFHMMKRREVLIFLAVLAVIYSIAAYHLAKPEILRRIHGIMYSNAALCASGNAGYTIYDTKILKELDSGALNIPHLGLIYLKGLGYFLLSPFPWNISSLNQLIAYPQVILWYLLLFFAIAGVIRGLNILAEESVFMIIYVCIGVSLWAVAEGNIGAAFRHRDYFSPIIFIYSSAGILHFCKKYIQARRGGQ